MFSLGQTLIRRPRPRAIAVVVAASMLLVAGYTGGLALAGRSSVSGRFSSVVVPPPTCNSPVGLCTEGTLTGGLKGTFSFRGTSVIQTVDTPSTTVVLYTGDLTVRTKDGELMCKDAGALRTIAEGAVSSVCTIVTGTGAYSGVTGTLQFVGNFSSTIGGVGDYTGSLVTP